MIFVTVGTHEQPFDRLIKCIDDLKGSGEIREDVIIQSGFSDYEPKHCIWKKLLPYEEMEKNVREARIVITHGGPASFMMPLQMGKVPIVVPRQARFGEHINNHQVEFCKRIAEFQREVIIVEDIKNVKKTICNYNVLVSTVRAKKNDNNAAFCNKFDQVVSEFFGKGNNEL